MSVRLLALVVGCVVLVGCSSAGGRPGTVPAAAGRAAQDTASTSPSPYPWSDCGALRAGDPLDLATTRCDPEEWQVRTVDCARGSYVHLSRPGLSDLEGIDGVTPWREAGAVGANGATAWAYENCPEHG